MKQKWMVLFLLALLSALGVPAEAARAEKKIGVLMWSEDPAYYETWKGIMDQLKKEGLVEPLVSISLVNARGGKAKLSEMAHRFALAKMDVVVTIGTSATIAAAREIQDRPLVFAYVYDPVESGIVRKLESSGNNTTGASSGVSMPKVLNYLQEFSQVRRLAVLYTPGETNSELQLHALQKALADSHVKVVPVIISREEEVIPLLQVVVPAVDAIYLSGSRIVSKQVSVIVDMATKARVITITHRDDLVDRGVLLGICANPYLVGRLAGEKIVKVLKGGRPSSIPIGHLSRFDLKLNMKTAKAGGFRPSPSFMKSVTKLVE